MTENTRSKPVQGMKVIYTGSTDRQVRWGQNDDPRLVLKEGKTYEIDNVDVCYAHTKVSLVGIDGWFNSVSFQD